MTVLDRLEILAKGLAGLCLAAVFVLVTTQVACRYLLNYPFPSASELSIYAMIWSIFLGAAIAFRDSQHIAMSLLKDNLPERLRRIVTTLIFLGLTLFLCIIIVKGYDLSGRAMRQISPAAGVPVGYVSAAMPVCSVLSLIFLIENFLKQVKAEKGA